VRSSGKRGRLGLAIRLPTADSLCSLKVARASKISGRKFSAAARRKRTAFKSAEMAARRCNAAAVGASSSPRSIRSQRESAVGRRTTRRGLSPFARRPHRTPPPPRSAAPLPLSSHRAVSPRVDKIARPGVLVLAEAWIAHSFPSSGKWGRAASLARGDRAVPEGACANPSAPSPFARNREMSPFSYRGKETSRTPALSTEIQLAASYHGASTTRSARTSSKTTGCTAGRWVWP